MSDRNWVRIGTFGGIGALAVILAFAILKQPDCATKSLETGRGTDKTEEGSAYEGEVTCYADCQVSFANPGPPSGEAVGADNQGHTAANSLQKADVCAQQSMAWWASFVGVFTAIGAALLILTLAETYVTAKVAGVSADASKLQAQAAINAGRAFLHPLDAKVRPYAPGKEGEALDTYMGFYSRIHNRGAGTGFLWRFAVGHEIVQHDHQPKGDIVRVGDYLGRTPIAEDGHWGADAALLAFKLSAEDIEKLTETGGRYWLHVFGYFEYTDLFGILRQTGFHFSYIPKSRSLIIERDPRLWFDHVVEPGRDEQQQNKVERHLRRLWQRFRGQTPPTA